MSDYVKREDVDAKLAERDRLWREYLRERVEMERHVLDPNATYDCRRMAYELVDWTKGVLVAHGAQVDG